VLSTLIPDLSSPSIIQAKIGKKKRELLQTWGRRS
jgi:hypothetical protein